jgi:hypothetical protein
MLGNGVMALVMPVWLVVGGMSVALHDGQALANTARCTERREETLPRGSSYSHSHNPLYQKGEASMLTPLASPDEPERTGKLPQTNADDQQHEQSEANPEHGLPVAGCNGLPLYQKLGHRARPASSGTQSALPPPTTEGWDACSARFMGTYTGTMPMGTFWCRSCRTARHAGSTRGRSSPR